MSPRLPTARRWSRRTVAAPAGELAEPARVQASDLLAPAGFTILLALVVALTLALVGRGASSLPAPPPIVVVAPPPSSTAAVAASGADPLLTAPTAAQQRLDMERFRRGGAARIPARWIAGFYRVYDVASRTFGVNWLLLASVHAQETSFSTSAGTYHGLNFAGCCGGPMQFNVVNGPVTTWMRFADSYRFAARPVGYPSQTATHPSIYDDFDSIMAGARLLRTAGAGIPLDATAWRAAYDYYGHDATGIVYADQVLARAISWSEHGFCANCALDDRMVGLVHEAYGAPVQAAQAAPRPAVAHAAARR